MEHINYKVIKAAETIKKGGLVLFPTETVYGIGANGLNPDAVKRVYEAKGRNSDNPLIFHVSNFDMVNSIAHDISEIEFKIMNTFWPGPLTIVLNKNDNVPDVATANLQTVGVRMPSHKIAHDIIELAGVPIAAPSANISGRPSGTNIEDIVEELKDRVDYIVNGGCSEIGVESTVIRVLDNEIVILRPGKITKEDFERLGMIVKVDKNVLNEINENSIVLSPGQKYKHYAPKSKCVLVYSKNNDIMIKKMKEIGSKYKTSLFLIRSSNKQYFDNYIDMGDTLDEISHKLFSILRKVDKYNVDIVIIEGFEKQGLGLAIMNRLIRACSHNYIEL